MPQNIEGNVELTNIRAVFFTLGINDWEIEDDHWRKTVFVRTPPIPHKTKEAVVKAVVDNVPAMWAVAWEELPPRDKEYKDD